LRPCGRGIRTLQTAEEQPQERAVETVQVAKQITHGAIHNNTSLYFSVSIISPLAAKVKRKAQILFWSCAGGAAVGRSVSPAPWQQRKTFLGAKQKSAANA